MSIHAKSGKVLIVAKSKNTDEMIGLQLQMVESLEAMKLTHENEKKIVMEERASMRNAPNWSQKS